MNVHDSEKLAGSLEAEGYREAPSAADADVVLLNTCSIREKAAEKVFGELGRLRPLKDANPDLKIGVCGCVAQQEGERVRARAPYVDFVVGPRATSAIPKLLRDASPDAPAVDTAYRRDSIDFPHDRIRRRIEHGKAYVTVVEGCNHRCTYCIVPTTRGREVCRPMDGVLDEVRGLAAAGVVEIEFLGQTVNAYRDESGNTLAELLRAASRIDGIRRIRFTTSHPAQMTDRIIGAMADASPVVCPYLHLPVQSGSSSVLRDMRRGYDRERYLDRIARLRDAIPGIALGTDIIVGFPTEGDAEFRDTLSLLDEVRYDTCYSFMYSPRPGTVAEAMDDPIPHEVKLERLQILQERQKGIQASRNRAWAGLELEVLVEGKSRRNASRWTGRTPEYRVVNFTGAARPGTLERIRILATSAFSLRGVVAEAQA